MKLTIVIEDGENGWFVGQIQQVPAAISQGKTIEELKTNLKEVLNLLLPTVKVHAFELKYL